MPELGQRISFVELLDNCERVRIPQLQRDYAQGRESAREVRDRFLEALLEALLLPPDDASLPLNLDFVYGSITKIKEDGAGEFLFNIRDPAATVKVAAESGPSALIEATTFSRASA